MQIILQNARSNDTVHATVRMNATELQRLREYMHCTGIIAFPNSVELHYRGRGWYRVSPTKSHEAIRNVQFATATLKRFARMLEEEVEAEIKALMPMMLDSSLKPTSFVPESGLHFTAPVMKDSLTHSGLQNLHSLASRFGTTLKVRDLDLKIN